MEIYNGLGFSGIEESDIKEMTGIMKRAFDEDAHRHLGDEEGGPPGYDNGDFLRKWYLKEEANAYKVLRDGGVIGGIVVFTYDNNINYLGNMFIDPLVQDKGIGTIIWRFIEQKYNRTKIWKTDTPGFSKRNHYFYINKCGFKVVRIDNPRNKYDESYILEKIM